MLKTIYNKQLIALTSIFRNLVVFPAKEIDLFLISSRSIIWKYASLEYDISVFKFRLDKSSLDNYLKRR